MMAIVGQMEEGAAQGKCEEGPEFRQACAGQKTSRQDQWVILWAQCGVGRLEGGKGG